MIRTYYVKKIDNNKLFRTRKPATIHILDYYVDWDKYDEFSKYVVNKDSYLFNYFCALNSSLNKRDIYFEPAQLIRFKYVK